jgi:hypothetical protein
VAGLGGAVGLVKATMLVWFLVTDSLPPPKSEFMSSVDTDDCNAERGACQGGVPSNE